MKSISLETLKRAVVFLRGNSITRRDYFDEDDDDDDDYDKSICLLHNKLTLLYYELM